MRPVVFSKSKMNSLKTVVLGGVAHSLSPPGIDAAIHHILPESLHRICLMKAICADVVDDFFFSTHICRARN